MLATLFLLLDVAFDGPFQYTFGFVVRYALARNGIHLSSRDAAIRLAYTVALRENIQRECRVFVAQYYVFAYLCYAALVNLLF